MDYYLQAKRHYAVPYTLLFQVLTLFSIRFSKDDHHFRVLSTVWTDFPWVLSQLGSCSSFPAWSELRFSPSSILWSTSLPSFSHSSVSHLDFLVQWSIYFYKDFPASGGKIYWYSFRTVHVNFDEYNSFMKQCKNLIRSSETPPCHVCFAGTLVMMSVYAFILIRVFRPDLFCNFDNEWLHFLLIDLFL